MTNANKPYFNFIFNFILIILFLINVAGAKLNRSNVNGHYKNTWPKASYEMASLRDLPRENNLK